ncbi:MAG: hypothetical protein KC621_02335 [Myxococcales bacterium]|nr:hypothetical protein [Myxococcales bacterium]MCB0923014.1 DUF4878 domain-containing protein [Mycobacterium sp.]
MSHPSGTGHDPQEPQPSDEPRPPEVGDSDPVTEVITVATDAEPSETAAAADDAAAPERRYTAPGFDAGSTQVIDQVADPPTEFITTPTEAVDNSRPRTGPQEIPAVRKARPRWIRPVAVMAAVLIGAALIGLFLVHRSNAAKASRENMVRTTIEKFDSAIRDGDLATLRDITCGQTRDSYLSYDDQDWSDTYPKVAAAKQFPVVASIDHVVVNGDHAEANVTSYMAYDPATTSTRSFDLQFRDDQWKICQAS